MKINYLSLYNLAQLLSLEYLYCSKVTSTFCFKCFQNHRLGTLYEENRRTEHKVKHHRNSDTKRANRDHIRTTALELGISVMVLFCFFLLLLLFLLWFSIAFLVSVSATFPLMYVQIVFSSV